MKSQKSENIEENIMLICQTLHIDPPNVENESVSMDEFLSELVERGLLNENKIELITNKRTSL